MAYFKIEEPDKEVKWIKSVDGASGKIEFTNNTENAYYRDSGFFADSAFDFIKFHFKNAYPELEYMSIDNDLGTFGWTVEVAEVAAH